MLSESVSRKSKTKGLIWEIGKFGGREEWKYGSMEVGQRIGLVSNALLS
jgi:hypothetical protein